MASDAVLLQKYASSRDANTFAELVARHADMVYATCLRITGSAHDAEDIAQECFAALARKAGAVRSSLPGWLHATATRMSLNAIRDASTRRRHEAQAMRTRQETEEKPWVEISPIVDRVIEELPEELRTPLVLHYLEKRSQRKIARQLQVNQSTVSRRIERGVFQVRRKLKKAGVIAPAALLTAFLLEQSATAAPATLSSALGKMAVTGLGAGGKTAATIGGITLMKTSIAVAVIAASVIGGAVLKKGMAADTMTAQQLIDKYQAAQAKLQQYIVKGESHADYFNKYSGKHKQLSGKHDKHIRLEFRFDGERFHLFMERWGSVLMAPQFSEETPSFTSWLWDGKTYLTNAGTLAKPPQADQVLIDKTPGPEEKLPMTQLAGSPEGPLMGYMLGDDERIDTILKNAKSISLREKQERVNESNCYVIEAKTNRGEYVVWIDPERGYHIVRAASSKREKDLMTHGKPLGKDTSIDFSVQTTRFDKVDGLWIPMAAETKAKSVYANGDFWTVNGRYVRTEIALNPDFDALGSFLPTDVREGATARIRDAFNIEYRVHKLPKEKWKNQKSMREADENAADQVDSRAVTAQQLIDKYQATQAKLQRFISISEEHVWAENKLSGRWAHLSGTMEYDGRHEFRSDGSKSYYRKSQWSDSGALSQFSEENPGYVHYLWDGKQYLVNQCTPRLPTEKDRVGIHKKPKERDVSWMYSSIPESPLLGYLARDTERVDSILRGAESISVRRERESVNGSGCYVIDAETEWGKYAVWIDPNHGFNIAKAKVEKAKGDYRMFRQKLKEGGYTKMVFSFTASRFEKIDGVWAPMEGEEVRDWRLREMDRMFSKHHVKRIKMTLNPDFDALGSFLPNFVREGAQVTYMDVPDRPSTTWRKSKPVLDADDNVSDQVGSQENELVAVKPNNVAETSLPKPEPQSPPVVSTPEAEAAASATDRADFPWAPTAVLAALIAALLSGLVAWRRRRG